MLKKIIDEAKALNQRHFSPVASTPVRVIAMGSVKDSLFIVCQLTKLGKKCLQMNALTPGEHRHLCVHVAANMLLWIFTSSHKTSFLPLAPGKAFHESFHFLHLPQGLYLLLETPFPALIVLMTSSHRHELAPEGSFVQLPCQDKAQHSPTAPEHCNSTDPLSPDPSGSTLISNGHFATLPVSSQPVSDMISTHCWMCSPFNGRNRTCAF